jgi:hypothetical protein
MRLIIEALDPLDSTPIAEYGETPKGRTSPCPAARHNNDAMPRGKTFRFRGFLPL